MRNCHRTPTYLISWHKSNGIDILLTLLRFTIKFKWFFHVILDFNCLLYFRILERTILRFKGFSFYQNCLWKLRKIGRISNCTWNGKSMTYWNCDKYVCRRDFFVIINGIILHWWRLLNYIMQISLRNGTTYSILCIGVNY